jgi:hypothetical protein
MAYNLSERAPGASNLTAKNRVWGFFENSNRTCPANRRKPSELHRKNRLTPTKTASGIPYWPSRDPIQEQGGLNLYGFVRNNGVGRIDVLGMEGLEGYEIVDWATTKPIYQRLEERDTGELMKIGEKAWDTQGTNFYYAYCGVVHWADKANDGKPRVLSGSFGGHAGQFAMALSYKRNTLLDYMSEKMLTDLGYRKGTDIYIDAETKTRMIAKIEYHKSDTCPKNCQRRPYIMLDLRYKLMSLPKDRAKSETDLTGPQAYDSSGKLHASQPKFKVDEERQMKVAFEGPCVNSDGQPVDENGNVLQLKK